MGCCASDALPDIPTVVREDPPVDGPVTFVTKRIGSNGRDFSVHENEYPSNKEDIVQKMWFWLNKSDGGVIDVENFVRGKNEGQPDKGEVLYSATVTERPHFDQVQRSARNGRFDLGERFMGFFGIGGGGGNPMHGGQSDSGYDSEDDFYYINHKNHKKKFHERGKRHSTKPHHNMITKWKLHTQATISCGTTGRAPPELRSSPIILEVFAKGTCATGWEDIEHTSTDSEGRKHTKTETEKRETEWVDRIEFRLSCNNQLWAAWYVIGDTHYNPGADVQVVSSLCTSTAVGGWFSSSQYLHQTAAGVDPALALLVHHLCNTEYSIAELKHDLKPTTPRYPPPAFNNPVFGGSMHHKGASLGANSFTITFK